jgi:hypothetical protein
MKGSVGLADRPMRNALRAELRLELVELLGGRVKGEGVTAI